MTLDSIGGEFCRQPLPRIGQSGADRHEHARRAGTSAQQEGRDGERAENRHRGHQREAARLPRSTGRDREREDGRGADDHQHGDKLTPAHGLVQPEDRDHEQEQQAQAEQRLDERQRRMEERERLQAPAEQSECRARDPAWAAHETTKQRKTQRLLDGCAARRARLQDDPDRVQNGTADRRCHSDDHARHAGPSR
jgi:hypothetical protein